MKEDDMDMDMDTTAAVESLQFALHQCSFINFDISGITAISADFQRSGTRFVLARENGDLETHSAQLKWNTEQFVSNTIPREKTITSIVEFVKDKVFTATLDGFLTLWDMVEGKQYNQLNPGGGAIWCMELEPVDNRIPRLGLGCEDGRVRIVTFASEFFESMSSSLLYTIQSLDASQSRVLSISWSLEDQTFILAAEAAGTIRKLDTQRGNCVEVMKISEKGSPVVIWSVIALNLTPKHRYYISGDERGVLTVWDGITCTALKELTVENCTGDITSLTAVMNLENPNKEGTRQAEEHPDVTVFFGSVDGGIGALTGQWVDVDPNTYQWLPVRARSLHSRDVKVVKNIGSNIIVSGGADCRLSILKCDDFFSDARAVRLCPCRAPYGVSSVKYYRKCGLLVAEHDKRIDFWQLSSSGGDRVLLRYRSRKLGGNICCSAVSDDLSWFAVSTRTSIRIYHLRCVINGAIAIEVEPFYSVVEHGARRILFISCNSLSYYLVTLSSDANKVYIYQISHSGDEPVRLIMLKCLEWKDLFEDTVFHGDSCVAPITCLAAQEEFSGEQLDCLFFVLGDKYGNIFIFDVFRLDCSPTKMSCFPSQSICSICWQQSTLIAVGAQGEIRTFRTENQSDGCVIERDLRWSENCIRWLKDELFSALGFFPIYGVDMDANIGCFLLYGHDFIVLVHWNGFEEVLGSEEMEKMRTTNKAVRKQGPNANFTPDQVNLDHSSKVSFQKKIRGMPSRKLKILYPLQNVSYACFMSSTHTEHAGNVVDILCMTQTWEQMLAQLPAAVVKKRFGT
eukprot:jgi/Galph1/4990/GphlegSOOS_G3674.1